MDFLISNTYNETTAQFMYHRLRSDTKILGYSRLEGDTTYFSKDAFWWSGKSILFDDRDRSFGIKDKNNKPLFEQDIVRVFFKDDAKKSKLIMLRIFNGKKQWIDARSNKLQFECDLADDHKHESMLAKVKSLEFVSYAFLNY